MGDVNPKHVLPCLRKFVGANLKVAEEESLVDINAKVTTPEIT